MDPPEPGQRRFLDCGHLGNVLDTHRSCFTCRDKIGQCTVDLRCPSCSDWILQWFEDVKPRHTYISRSKSHSSKNSNDSSRSHSSLSRPCLPVVTPVDSNKEPKKRSNSGSRGTNSNIFNKKLLEKVSDSKGKLGKGTEKAGSARKSSQGSTGQSSRAKSKSPGRMTSPARQSADGSMAAPGENSKSTEHLPQASFEVVTTLSSRTSRTPGKDIASAIPGMSIQDSHANRTSRREVALTGTCHTPGPMVDTFKVVNGNANRTSLRGCEEALTGTTRTPGSTPPVTGHVGSIV